MDDTSIATVKLPPAEKMTPERVYGKNGSVRKTKVPITATPYTVASLQVATNSFCQDSLLGEGSLGRVYKADFPNGKVQCAYIYIYLLYCISFLDPTHVGVSGTRCISFLIIPDCKVF